MNNAIQREREQSLLDTLKKCASLFVSFSPALLTAFFAMRIMEILAISRASNIPPDIRTVMVKAFLYDCLSFLEIVPFFFVPFLLVCLGTRTRKSRYLIYGIGGSILILLYAVLINTLPRHWFPWARTSSDIPSRKLMRRSEAASRLT